MKTMFSFRNGSVGGFLLCLSLLSGATTQAAQSSASEVNPAVQKLYAEARTAQQQGDASTAIAKYQAMLRLAPDLAPAYNNLGMLYFNQHDYAAAAPVLAHGLRLNPAMTTAAAMLGLCYFELGENQKAEPLLEKASAANPSDENVQMSLAHVLLALGKSDEATSHLQEYVKGKPNDQEAWYLLGKTYLQMSEDALGRVNQIDPNSYIAHEVAGEIDESMKNYDGALVEFQKAVELAPDEPGTHLRLANVYWVMGKWDSAQQEFRTELDHAPTDCVARWKLANSMLQANGPNEEILKNLNEAIDRCPQLMQARVDRAHVLIGLKKESQALADLLLAKKENPDEPSIHFLLASVYKAQGQPEHAKQELHIYAELQRAASAAVAEQANEAITLKSAAH
ncbi:MAG TPA: tetratricopeptide repeat protein [Acidobacteriaceae bacterium]|nr:tetratricopeptide repeat protein [Acidobacteriaceae bacterium]